MSELKTAVQIAMEKSEVLYHPIPTMTSPLSAYWAQPSRKDILIDDKHALMSKETFRMLPEYSLSIPTGVYKGKMWKANKAILHVDSSWEKTDTWFLRWYGFADRRGYCPVEGREIIIVG